MLEAGVGLDLIYITGKATLSIDANPHVSGTQEIGDGFGAAFLGVVGYRYQGDLFNFRIGGDLFITATGLAALPHLSVGLSF